MSAELLLDREVDVKRFTRRKLKRFLEGGGRGFVTAALRGPERWVAGSEDSLHGDCVIPSAVEILLESRKLEEREFGGDQVIGLWSKAAEAYDDSFGEPRS